MDVAGVGVVAIEDAGVARGAAVALLGQDALDDGPAGRGAGVANVVVGVEGRDQAREVAFDREADELVGECVELLDPRGFRAVVMQSSQRCGYHPKILRFRSNAEKCPRSQLTLDIA